MKEILDHLYNVAAEEFPPEVAEWITIEVRRTLQGEFGFLSIKTWDEQTLRFHLTPEDLEGEGVSPEFFADNLVKGFNETLKKLKAERSEHRREAIEKAGTSPEPRRFGRRG